MFENTLDYLELPIRFRRLADEYRAFLATPGMIITFPSLEICSPIVNGSCELLKDVNLDSFQQLFDSITKKFDKKILLHGLFDVVQDSEADCLVSTEDGISINTLNNNDGLTITIHDRKAQEPQSEVSFIAWRCSIDDSSDLGLLTCQGKLEVLRHMVDVVSERFVDASAVATFMVPFDLEKSSKAKLPTRPLTFSKNTKIVGFKPRSQT